LNTTNSTRFSSFVAMLAVALCGAAAAKESHATLVVTAAVNAVADLTVASAPQALEVTPADLQRGYIDVTEPTTLRVHSNSPTGFALDVLTVAPMLASMVVAGLASEQILGADGGTLVQRWRAPGSVDLTLEFRLLLAPGLSPGRYPWPLRLAVRPLDGAAPLTASTLH
jgi:hypothetical protein